MKAKKPYTAAELRQFDRLTAMLSSQRQMDRIHARVTAVPAFVKKHGEAKCKTMYEELKRRDRR
jgi:hypothetical protein